MTALHLLCTCPVCGAQESLDAAIARVADDEQMRHLVAAAISHSLPVGGDVLRYLRLHKPAKHRLSLVKARAILEELLPAIQYGFARKGRTWTLPTEGWSEAFAAVFKQAEGGTLQLPLNGNAYLFEVALQIADRHEAREEAAIEQARRGGRPWRSDAPTDMAGILAAALSTPTKDPALLEIEASRQRATPMPDYVRERLQQMKSSSPRS